MKNKIYVLIIFNLFILTIQNLRKQDENLTIKLEEKYTNLSREYLKMIVSTYDKSNNSKVNDNIQKSEIYRGNISDNLVYGEVEKFIPLFINDNYNFKNIYDRLENPNNEFKNFSFFNNNHLYEGGNIFKGVKIKETEQTTKNEKETGNVYNRNNVDLAISGSTKILGFLN